MTALEQAICKSCGETFAIAHGHECRGIQPHPVSSNQDSTELYYAEMEAARNTAEAAYFDARPLLDREGPPVTAFRAGFERAFQLLWNRRSVHETKARRCWWPECKETTGEAVVDACNRALAPSRRVESVLDFRVTVCSECLCACCWQGTFYCESYRDASTTIKTVRELHELRREDPGFWFKSADDGKVNYTMLEAYRSAVKSVCKPSASTDDHVTPSREPPSSSVECPKCRTQLAFEGDECGLCKEEE